MNSSDKPRQKVFKVDAEWQQQLSPAQYHVTREHGTERTLTGPYWNEKGQGLYSGVCCRAPLFSSDTKYDSGTGWPSLWAPVERGALSEHSDRSFFMSRTEVRCAACEAHLGYVFPDDRKPTGQRCMNGTALSFAPGDTQSK